MDMELKTATGSVKAHKVLLAAESEYFRTLFTGPFKEQSENVIDLSGTFDSVDGLQETINYLYGIDIHITEEKLRPLLHAASILQIPELTIACGYYMVEKVTLQNCLIFWMLCNTYSLAELCRPPRRVGVINRGSY